MDHQGGYMTVVTVQAVLYAAAGMTLGCHLYFYNMYHVAIQGLSFQGNNPKLKTSRHSVLF